MVEPTVRVSPTVRVWRWTLALFAAMVAGFAAGFAGVAAAQSVVTYHGSADRSGLYTVPALTWAKAGGVRKDSAFKASVDGSIYSQPLYWLPPVGGIGRLIVATETNKVYALNANTGAKIWETTLGTPVPLSMLPCGNIDPMGVTGTPAIDPDTGIVYLEALVLVANQPRHKVFGLSLATGALAPGWPVDVANGLQALGKSFDNSHQGQRSALTIVNGRLFIPYAGHYGDCTPYYVMAVGLTLAKPRVFGAWMTRAMAGGAWGQSGIAYDGTSMFLTTGNTDDSGTAPKWGGGNGVIRLKPTLANSTSPIDYFTPKNWLDLDNQDLDLGGTSAIPVNVPGAAAPVARVLALGKDGKAYLLNRINLGGIGGQVAVRPVSNDEIITAMATYPAVNAAMVAFEGQGSQCPAEQSGNLVMLRITAKAIATAWCAAFDGLGAPIVTTTNGTANPIVWVVGAQGDGKLYGFRGTDGRLLVAAVGGSDPVQRYQTILAANGHFYVSADGAVYAFTY